MPLLSRGCGPLVFPLRHKKNFSSYARDTGRACSRQPIPLPLYCWVRDRQASNATKRVSTPLKPRIRLPCEGPGRHPAECRAARSAARRRTDNGSGKPWSPASRTTPIAGFRCRRRQHRAEPRRADARHRYKRRPEMPDSSSGGSPSDCGPSRWDKRRSARAVFRHNRGSVGPRACYWGWIRLQRSSSTTYVGSRFDPCEIRSVLGGVDGRACCER